MALIESKLMTVLNIRIHDKKTTVVNKNGRGSFLPHHIIFILFYLIFILSSFNYFPYFFIIFPVNFIDFDFLIEQNSMFLRVQKFNFSRHDYTMNIKEKPSFMMKLLFAKNENFCYFYFCCPTF